MRASPILLLVYAGIVMLSFAASAEQEMLTIGKYDISFSESHNIGFDETNHSLLRYH
ncbi:MAG: hypothetical protein NTY37_07130 [Methanothrix sp.]|nr:hypothetical protein [Methanothrix sp.]